MRITLTSLLTIATRRTEMTKRILSLLLMFAFSLQAFAQPQNETRLAKKQISKIVHVIKKTSNLKKKEAMINYLVTKINMKLSNIDQSSLTLEEAEAVTTLQSNILNAHDRVKGGSAEEMNEFSSYLESEINQASPVVIVGLMLLFTFFLWKLMYDAATFPF